MASPFTNTIRFGSLGAGSDRHPVLNMGAADIVPGVTPLLSYPFPDAAFPGGPQFAPSFAPEAWLNVSRWRFEASFSALGRSVQMNSIGPAGRDYDPDTQEWDDDEPVSRFDLLTFTESVYAMSAVLVTEWLEDANDRRSINASLNLRLGKPQYFDGRWWAGLSISATAVQDIDTSGTGQFLDEDVETTVTGLFSDPEGEDRGITFLGLPVLMSPLPDGIGDVSFSASIEAAAYYTDWFDRAA